MTRIFSRERPLVRVHISVNIVLPELDGLQDHFKWKRGSGERNSGIEIETQGNSSNCFLVGSSSCSKLGCSGKLINSKKFVLNPCKVFNIDPCFFLHNSVPQAGNV